MARRLKVILLEAGVELAPPEIQGHPQIVRTARIHEIMPSEVLLDKSLHYHAMAPLPRKWKRGRPDITHLTLLVLLESLAGRKGMVEVYMHTVNDEVYAFNPKVRIPKHYDRFKGLMAQLLRIGRVPPKAEEPLIYRVSDSLDGFLARQPGLILMWEHGTEASEDEIVRQAVESEYLIGIGAFPRGDFDRRILRKATATYSIAGGEPLTTWAIACRLVTSYEKIYLL